MIYNPISIDKFSIYDIFHNSLDNIVIVSPWSKTSLDVKYKNNNFDTLICPHKHTILYVLKNKTEYNKIIELNINGQFITTKVNKYPDFKNEIIMSTIVCNEDDYIIQWIKFHNNIGINRFIIYDNKKDNLKSNDLIIKQSNLEYVLKDFIKDGLVILIRWNYPYIAKESGISGQTTQQNHSIWSFKTCKYIGMFDIDEYINIQTTNTNINYFFNNLIENMHINTNDVGSFRLLNKFFFNPDDLPTNDYNFLQIYNCSKISLKNYEKGFVIPKNVYIYSVHMITFGKCMYIVPPELLYFNHYFFLNKSNRGKNKTMFIDTSIKKHTKFICN
jgi:hypothetical protein